MALWDKLKNELDRAGRAAQSALDEGKIRLEAFRVRQLADKAAQALGYAVYRARQGGKDVEPDTYARLSSTLAGHEAEAVRLEERLREAQASKAADRAPPRPDTPPPARPAATPPPATPNPERPGD